MLLSNQIAAFLCHQYLWNETISVLMFFVKSNDKIFKKYKDISDLRMLQSDWTKAHSINFSFLITFNTTPRSR